MHGGGAFNRDKAVIKMSKWKSGVKKGTKLRASEGHRAKPKLVGEKPRLAMKSLGVLSHDKSKLLALQMHKKRTSLHASNCIGKHNDDIKCVV